MARVLRRPWTWVVAGIVVVAVAGVSVWWFGVRDATASDELPEVTTQTVTASLTTLEKSVSASGTLTPKVQESVSFEAGGTVTSVAVAEGDTVTAGQTLATIDTLELNSALLEAQATLASAQAKLADSEDADDGSTAASAQIEANSAAVDVAQAKVDAAQEAMADATLVAPVAGLVTSVDLEVGDVVSGSSSGTTGSTSAGGAGGSTGGAGATSSAGTSSAQFTIVGTDAWTVELSVDESDIANVATGDQAELTVDGVSDTVFGTVSAVGLIPTTSGGVAGYPVTVDVTGSPTGLHDGVSADVEIIYERRTDVLTVPSVAVTTVDGASTVTQLDESGNEVSTPVTVGETSGNVTEITDGLAEGDSVLIRVVQRSGQQSDGDSGSRQGGYGYPGGDGQMPDFSGGQMPDFGGGQMPDLGGGQMPGGSN